MFIDFFAFLAIHYCQSPSPEFHEGLQLFGPIYATEEGQIVVEGLVAVDGGTEVHVVVFGNVKRFPKLGAIPLPFITRNFLAIFPFVDAYCGVPKAACSIKVCEPSKAILTVTLLYFMTQIRHGTHLPAVSFHR